MKRLPYFLVFLLISAQVDDAWAVASDLPSAPVADDNDEYLPAQRGFRDEQSSGQETAFVGIERRSADCSFVGRARFEWNLTTPFTPRPLYVFMSLQI
jgi:hypothetical protein